MRGCLCLNTWEGLARAHERHIQTEVAGSGTAGKPPIRPCSPAHSRFASLPSAGVSPPGREDAVSWQRGCPGSRWRTRAISTKRGETYRIPEKQGLSKEDHASTFWRYSESFNVWYLSLKDCPGTNLLSTEPVPVFRGPVYPSSVREGKTK